MAGILLKFDDCQSCSNQNVPQICSSCGLGELYEADVSDALDFSGDISEEEIISKYAEKIMSIIKEENNDRNPKTRNRSRRNRKAKAISEKR